MNETPIASHEEAAVTIEFSFAVIPMAIGSILLVQDDYLSAGNIHSVEQNTNAPDSHRD